MIRFAALAAGALILAGCSASTPKAAPATSASAAPAGCAQALALLPSQVPNTEDQADAAESAIGGVHGTTVDSMRDQVASDLLNLSFTLGQGGDVASAVGQYKADVQALRSYCAP